MDRRRFRRFRRFLGGGSIAVATVLLALAAPGARAADPALKACVASCNEARTACSLEVAADFEGSELACAKAGDERACLGQAKRLQKAGKRACKGSRKACKRCCKEDPKSCVLPPELPEATGSFELPDRAALPAALEAAGFPPGPEGRGFAVLRLPDGVFFIDPSARSAASAAGECADAMLACVAPPERNPAGCFAALATCRGKPWKGDAPACCPTACGERYQALRREGIAEGDAFAAAIFEQPSCIPRLEGHVEPEPVRRVTKRSVLLCAALLAACLDPRAARAWDVRCVRLAAANVECADPFANVRTVWRNHPLAEHRLLLVESLQIAGLPASLQDEFELTVYAGSETFDAAGGVYDSVRPVLTGAELEQSRTLTVQMMANMPDFSYTLWDWASGNEVCPPDPGSPALACHNYEAHIGWLNSNHMLPQARRWYGYLHGLAVERAGACKDAADALEPPHEARFLPWLLACEKEAMVIEAVAQHYLQDAWAIGHMMERWGSTETADFDFNQGLGFLISGFVGAVHGSKAMLDEDPIFGPQGPWDDPANAPHADVGYVDGLDGPLPRPGVGDRFLPQLLGFLPGLDDYSPQREALFGCAVDGLREVYAASAQLHGALVDPGAGFDARRQVEDDSCWAQRLTNRTFDTGIGVHRGAFDGPPVRVIPGVVGWTLSDVIGFFLLGAPVTTPETRERFQTDAAYIATRAALRAQDSPDGTEMASGAGGLSFAGIGSNSVYARGGPGVPPSGYSDPLLPWGLSDADPQVEERKQALNLTFADAHAADRCGDFSAADLEAYVDAARDAAAGSDPEAAIAACGQCVQLVAPHLRFGVEGDHDPNREAFCALVAAPPLQPAFLYTEEDPVFTGAEPTDLASLLAAARARCCTTVTPGEVEVQTGVFLDVEHSTDFDGEADTLGEEEGRFVPFNRTLTATSLGGAASAGASMQVSESGGSANATGSGVIDLGHTLNDEDHSASGRAQSDLGIQICVAERSSFSVQAQVTILSDATEESTEAAIIFCCDDNGEEVARFASDAPGSPRNATLAVNGFIGARGRGIGECIEAGVELDALLQSGQTRSSGTANLTVSVSPAP